jgi:N-hydroxyarylamine O-acetyltransferase
VPDPDRPLTDDEADAYLDRIGLDRRPGTGSVDLDELHRRHLQRVPFENLSIHLGEPIQLDVDALFDKIVARRRGGFCYELNGLFAALLRTLGHRVDLLAASVHTPEGLSPPFDHVALRVGGRLVDVGFGRHSARTLVIDTTADQVDPHGTFRVVPVDGGDLDVLQDGEPQYRLEARSRRLSECAPTCWWQQSWPGSHFRNGPVCSIATESGGQLTLAGRRLTRTEDGVRTETDLGDDREVLDAYRDLFGVTLDRVPVAVTS